MKQLKCNWHHINALINQKLQKSKKISLERKKRNSLKSLLSPLCYLITLEVIKKATIIAINVLITQKLTKFKKKSMNFLQNFLNFLSYLMTVEAIRMQLTPLLAH